MEKETYSFLKDPRALAEIRKHKWLESQKAGEEIGFATAAVDWIQKYGRDWMKVHVADAKQDGSFLIERRKYRRFPLRGIVELIKNNAHHIAEAVDISLQGVLCRTTEQVHLGSQMCIRLFCGTEIPAEICPANIERVSVSSSGKYEYFLKFDRYDEQGFEVLRKLR